MNHAEKIRQHAKETEELANKLRPTSEGAHDSLMRAAFHLLRAADKWEAEQEIIVCPKCRGMLQPFVCREFQGTGKVRK